MSASSTTLGIVEIDALLKDSARCKAITQLSIDPSPGAFRGGHGLTDASEAEVTAWWSKLADSPLVDTLQQLSITRMVLPPSIEFLQAFNKLQVLSLDRCLGLKTVKDDSSTWSLSSLRTLNVFNIGCQEIEIPDEWFEQVLRRTPGLTKLQVFDMPIMGIKFLSYTPNLESLILTECDSMMGFTFTEDFKALQLAKLTYLRIADSVELDSRDRRELAALPGLTTFEYTGDNEDDSDDDDDGESD